MQGAKGQGSLTIMHVSIHHQHAKEQMPQCTLLHRNQKHIEFIHSRRIPASNVQLSCKVMHHNHGTLMHSACSISLCSLEESSSLSNSALPRCKPSTDCCKLLLAILSSAIVASAAYKSTGIQSTIFTRTGVQCTLRDRDINHGTHLHVLNKMLPLPVCLFSRFIQLLGCRVFVHLKLFRLHH